MNDTSLYNEIVYDIRKIAKYLKSTDKFYLVKNEDINEAISHILTNIINNSSKISDEFKKSSELNFKEIDNLNKYINNFEPEVVYNIWKDLIQVEYMKVR